MFVDQFTAHSSGAAYTVVNANGRPWLLWVSTVKMPESRQAHMPIAICPGEHVSRVFAPLGHPHDSMIGNSLEFSCEGALDVAAYPELEKTTPEEHLDLSLPALIIKATGLPVAEAVQLADELTA